MTTIEKEKALDVVRQMVADGQVSQDVAEKYFPELAESEDERIELLNYLYDVHDNDEERARWIAWLEKQGEEIIPLEQIILNVWELGNYWKELTKGFCNTEYGTQLDYIAKHWKEGEHYIKSLKKQGEQKPADKVEPKFHEGDIIIHKELGGDYIHNPHKIIQVDILDKKYRLEGGLVAHFGEQDDYELLEQKPSEWSEEDEEMIRYIGNAITTNDATQYLNEKGICIIDAHVWFEKLKDRVHPQPKQEWSEEDESRMDNLCHFLEEYGNQYYGYLTLQGTIAWLNSLRPKSTWKPSEEQMDVLETAVSSLQSTALESLYQNLTKINNTYDT